MKHVDISYFGLPEPHFDPYLPGHRKSMNFMFDPTYHLGNTLG